MANIEMNLKYFGANTIYVYLLVALIVIHCVYVWLTRFNRTITIKEKYNFASGSGKYQNLNNTVMDSEGRVYSISNSLPLLHFKAAEVMMAINKDKSYTVKGYGWRVPILGMFPNIVDVK